MSIKVQEAPQAPSYASDNIQVPANIATPQATMDGIKAQQAQLDAVNTLTGGRHRGTKHRRRRAHTLKHKSFIRTYKGRRYGSNEQSGGSSAASAGGQIPIAQVGPLCSSGPQCAGAQNANFTALNNQAKSNSINDAYMQSGGGRRRSRNKKVTFRHRHKVYHYKTKHDSSSTISHKIKEVLRKIFT
jgi:hypothetical protein